MNSYQGIQDQLIAQITELELTNFKKGEELRKGVVGVREAAREYRRILERRKVWEDCYILQYSAVGVFECSFLWKAQKSSIGSSLFLGLLG